jgi:hypothetical protein
MRAKQREIANMKCKTESEMQRKREIMERQKEDKKKKEKRVQEKENKPQSNECHRT